MMHTSESWESNFLSKRGNYITHIQWKLLLFSEKVGHLQVQLCYKKSAAAVIPIW